MPNDHTKFLIIEFSFLSTLQSKRLSDRLLINEKEALSKLSMYFSTITLNYEQRMANRGWGGGIKGERDFYSIFTNKPENNSGQCSKHYRLYITKTHVDTSSIKTPCQVNLHGMFTFLLPTAMWNSCRKMLWSGHY